MNSVQLLGNLARDPEIRFTKTGRAVAMFTVACTRSYIPAGSSEPRELTDFIPCVAFGKNGEFAEKYLHKGTKVIVIGRIQTGSYTNKDGHKVYTTDVIVEEQEFAESKNASCGNNSSGNALVQNNGGEDFMHIPDGIDEELPFN